MSPDQVLQLLSLHQKSVRQGWEKPHRRKRRGESWDTYTERLRAMWAAEQARAAEDAAVAAAALADRAAAIPPPPELPALEQVAGWSKAKGGGKHNPDLAMFGGWRIDDWRRREKRKP